MRRLAFLTMAVTAGVSWGLVVACSSDDGSTFDESQKDASFEGGTGFADGGLEEAGPVTCTTALPTDFAPVYVAPETQDGRCTSEQLGAYFDSCLGGSGGSVAACAAWRQANADCTSCIENDAGTGPVRTFADHKYSQVNVGGCVAIAQGTPGDGGACAAALQGAAQCQVASCLPCIQKADVTDEAITSCTTQSQAAGCAKYQSGVNAACADSNKAGAAAYDCFPRGAEQKTDRRTWVVRVMGVSCGSPTL